MTAPIQLQEQPNGVTRRAFIKGVIAAGAAVSATSYLFRGPERLFGQGSLPGAVERLMTLTVNGQQRRVDVMKQETLAMTLRYKLGLTGTKLGCDRSECGACTVHLRGRAVRSCQVKVADAAKAPVVTIEGLSPTGAHPLQQIWKELDVPECGYCQAGQIMSAAALLATTPKPSNEDIDRAMNGNLCRCGTYLRIREAIHKAASMAPNRAPQTARVSAANEAVAGR